MNGEGLNKARANQLKIMMSHQSGLESGPVVAFLRGGFPSADACIPVVVLENSPQSGRCSILEVESTVSL
jgi:hypothetical protein